MDLAKYNQNEDLITIEEYMTLLKQELNNNWYMNAKTKKETFINKLKENNIEINTDTTPHKVSKGTLPILIDKILSDIKVCNSGKCSKFAIIQTEFKVEYLNRFVALTEMQGILGEKYNETNAKNRIQKELPCIIIPFLHTTQRFFEKESVLKFVDEQIDAGKIRKIDTGMFQNQPNIDGQNWINMSECIKLLKQKLPTILKGKCITADTLRRRIKTKYSHINHIARPKFEISKKEIDTLTKSIIDDMEIVNIEPENDICDLVKYNISKEELTTDLLKKYVDKDYYCKTITKTNSWVTVMKRIPCIKTELVVGGIFFRKEAVDFIKYIHENGIRLQEVISTLNKKLDTDFSWRAVTHIIEKEKDIKTFSGVPNFAENNTVVILKQDIPKLEEILIERSNYKDCEDICSYMDRYMELNHNFSNLKIKKTLELYKKYIIEVNDGIDFKYTNNIFRECRQVYDLMTKCLEKELLLYSDEETEELLEKVDSLFTGRAINRFRLFYNYLMKETNQSARKIYKPSNVVKKILPYELESYFAVLGNIINFLNNKKNITDKLIGVTGARRLSGSILYILTHYTACWRSSDIVTKLPNADLKLIGFNSAKEFIEWFEKEDSVFTEEMGRLICTGIEHRIKVTRAVASKNDGKLLLYTSPFLYRIYGLILCICEVNRQRQNAKRMLPSMSADLVSKCIAELDAEIVKPIGKFGNRRANKSFETYISEKSEEWNMGVGYLMAAVARGHKLNERIYSETTKIYIEKDVDSMSFLAFSSGIFSGAKYHFLSLIDERFDGKTIQEKSVQAKDFSMTNYEIEIMLESVVKKRHAVDNFFKQHLYSEKVKRKTLHNLMYDKDCNSKHEYAKCLLRAYESTKDEKELDLSRGFLKKCAHIGNKSCIGCPMFIAEKYFLYELEERLKTTLKCLEMAKSDFDKLIHLGRIKDLFFPIIYEAMQELGPGYVKGIVSVDEMTIAYRKEKELLKMENKEGKMKVIPN